MSELERLKKVEKALVEWRNWMIKGNPTAITCKSYQLDATWVIWSLRCSLEGKGPVEAYEEIK